MAERIKLSLVRMSGTEQRYVDEVLRTGWIVPLGPQVDEFERRFSAFYAPGKRVVALSSGTAAIHLGLILAGVKPGDEVICQALTFAASANPVVYCGAKPVFVDSETDTWNMDPDLLEQAIADRIRLTGRTPRAIVPVHLFGMPAQLDRIMDIARRYDIPVVEDAAEALGSTFDDTLCGDFGEFGVLSFNGNKIITTSGGGAIICPSEEMAERALFYATQAREKRPYYYHEHIGYNYRLSNMSAAIGLGQLDILADNLRIRRHIHDLYTVLLEPAKPWISVMQEPSPRYRSNFWLSAIMLADDCPFTPEDLRQALEAENIESRRVWRPMQMQPIYADAPYYGGTVSEHIFDRGLCLPSGSTLTDEDIKRVATTILTFLKSKI